MLASLGVSPRANVDPMTVPSGRYRATVQEFGEADLSPGFRSNGTSMPANPQYLKLASGDFADYRLAVDGLVEKPASLSLAELHALPSRTQITRHDCVEGRRCPAAHRKERGECSAAVSRDRGSAAEPVSLAAGGVVCRSWLTNLSSCVVAIHQQRESARR